MKSIPTDPAKRYQYFVTQVALLKSRGAPESLIAICRAKMRDAKKHIPQTTTP